MPWNSCGDKDSAARFQTKISSQISGKVRSNLEELELPANDNAADLPEGRKGKVKIEEGVKRDDKENPNASVLGTYWEQFSLAVVPRVGIAMIFLICLTLLGA